MASWRGIKPWRLFRGYRQIRCGEKDDYLAKTQRAQRKKGVKREKRINTMAWYAKKELLGDLGVLAREKVLMPFSWLSSDTVWGKRRLSRKDAKIAKKKWIKRKKRVSTMAWYAKKELLGDLGVLARDKALMPFRGYRQMGCGEKTIISQRRKERKGKKK